MRSGANLYSYIDPAHCRADFGRLGCIELNRTSVGDTTPWCKLIVGLLHKTAAANPGRNVTIRQPYILKTLSVTVGDVTAGFPTAADEWLGDKGLPYKDYEWEMVRISYLVCVCL